MSKTELEILDMVAEGAASAQREAPHQFNFHQFPPPDLSPDGPVKVMELSESVVQSEGFPVDEVDGVMDVYGLQVRAFVALAQSRRAPRIQLLGKIEILRQRAKDINRHLQRLIMATRLRDDKKPTEEDERRESYLIYALRKTKATLAGFNALAEHDVKDWNDYIREYIRWEYDSASAMQDRKTVADKIATERKEMEHWYTSAMRTGIGPEPTGRIGKAVDDTVSKALKHHFEQPIMMAEEPEIPFRVPNWFKHLDNTIIPLDAGNEAQQFHQLMTRIGTLGCQVQSEKAAKAEPGAADKPFTKSWHEPNTGWPYETWRKNGGWWTCRSGDKASAMEKKCRECLVTRRESDEQTGQGAAARPLPAAKQYARIMAEIDRARDMINHYGRHHPRDPNHRALSEDQAGFPWASQARERF